MIPSFFAMLLVSAFSPMIDDLGATRIPENAQAKGTTHRQAAIVSGHVDKVVFDGDFDSQIMVGHGVARA